MKLFFIAILLVPFLHSDEMQRIDSIVKDIAKLRLDYEKCQESLESKKTIKADIVTYQKSEDESVKYKMLLAKEQERNIILQAEIDTMHDSLSDNDKMIKKYKKLLKTKEKEKLTLEKELKNSQKTSSKIVKPKEICLISEESNTFPKLMPKTKDMKTKEIKLKKPKTELQTFKASSFRLVNDAVIYDLADGKEIAKWEKHTSFTSNVKMSNWVKITGYFLNQRWRKAKKEMWIKDKDILKR